MRRIALLLLASVSLGCGTARLETGYRPRAIKASNVERRGYYAGAFSPAARAAEARAQESESEAGRNRAGY